MPNLGTGSGGSLPTGIVYVALTAVTAYGETTASPVGMIDVTGPSGSIAIVLPDLASPIVGYNVYAGDTALTLARQNAIPASGTYVLSGLVAGLAPPVVNTAGSPFPGYAFNRAMGLTIRAPHCGGSDYTLAVYNCAGHVQLTITPDQPGRTYFADRCKLYGLDKPSGGLVSGASDNGTSSTLAVPDALQQLTIGDLMFFKSPWGREYLSYAQDFGGVWGLT